MNRSIIPGAFRGHSMSTIQGSYHTDGNIRTLQHQLNQAHGKLGESQKENAELRHRLGDLESNIKKAQEDAFALAKRIKSTCYNDEQVRRELGILARSWKEWAYASAISSKVHLDHGNQVVVNELLREVMVNPEKNRSYELSDIIQHKKARKILLQAHLAKLITDRILTRPFHYIEDDVHKTMEPDDSNINGHYMQTFDNFYTNLMKVDEAKAQAWRAETVRAMEGSGDMPLDVVTPINYGSKRLRKDPEPTFEEDLESERQKYYKHEAEAFLSSRVGVLIEDSNHEKKAEFSQQMVKMLSEAAKLANQLWAQRLSIGCLGPLQPETHVFEIRSPMMEPHSLLLMDDEDHEFDGAPVRLVVCPAIVAHETGYGSNSANDKVWAKAVVWVSMQSVEDHPVRQPDYSCGMMWPGF